MIKAVCRKCRYLNVMHRVIFTGGGRIITNCKKCGNEVIFRLGPSTNTPSTDNSTEKPEESEKLKQAIKEAEERNA